MLTPLTGKTIFCISTQEWDAHWTPAQQVALRLAPASRVVYVEPFHPPFAWLKPSNRLLKEQRAQGVPQLREVRENLFVYRPGYPYLPRHLYSRVTSAVNRALYRAELRRLVQSFGDASPWLWVFFAQAATVLDLPFERVVYDCADDFPSFVTHRRMRHAVAAIDEQLYRRADIVFAGSSEIEQTKRHMNARTFVVNHAADIDHFAKAAATETVVPDDLERLSRPRVGFVGMVDAVRFDGELIKHLAHARPQYEIVLVGGFVNGARVGITVEAAPNVHFLGMKRVADLPSYLKGLDVCLMPYRVNETTRFIYPLKLHEYLATGKPVVTTEIPAVNEFRHLLRVATSPDEFVRQVDEAVAEHAPDLVRDRRATAARHTWEHHVTRKLDLIAEHVA